MYMINYDKKGNIGAGTSHQTKTGVSFFERAKKHIVKAKKGISRDLSGKVDAVVYGI